MQEDTPDFSDSLEVLIKKETLSEIANREIGESLKDPKEKMHGLFRRERRKISRRKFAKYAARAACVLLVIAIGCGVTVYNAEAWRLHFFIFLKAETSIFILKHTALTAGSPLRGK